MYGSMSRVSIAAMLVALKYPLSKAPALGLPKAKGMASQVGMASGLIVGMVGQGVGHNQETVLFHGGLGIVMLIKAIVVAVFHDA